MTQLSCSIPWLDKTSRTENQRASGEANPSIRHYRIGPIEVTLATQVAPAMWMYHELYRTYESATVSAGAFRVDVVARRSPRTGRLHYHIFANGEEEYTVRKQRQILAHIEGAINIMIARHVPDYLALHASVLARKDGVTLVMPGTPGSGKTTTAVGLLQRGWNYFSDEFALFDPASLKLHPYPKALSIKSGSYELLKDRIPALKRAMVHERTVKGELRCLSPLTFGSHVVAKPARARLIILPKFQEGASPTLQAMSPARAVFELSQHCFNLLKYRRRAVEILACVASGAKCYRMTTGDLDATCRLIEACADGARRTKAGEG